MHATPIEFGGNTLQLSEEQPEEGRLFVPRRAGLSRPKAGLGHARNAGQQKGSDENKSTASVKSQDATSQGKGQDDFRKMLSKT